MRRRIVIFAILALVLLAGALWAIRPRTDGPAVLAGLEPDLANGEMVFIASGCASCHMAEGATGDGRLVLAGGQKIVSPFGTFHVPNISQDPAHGIGSWSDLDLWNALHHGTTPDGQHLYPAFPYTSYIRLTPQQVVDLAAYLRTLPADPTPSQPHELGFPFTLRPALGAWKALYLRDGWVMAGDLSPELTRGREIVEAMGHCAERHSPRDALGGTKTGAAWLSAGPNPAGGTFPDLTPPALGWSEAELVEYFTSGFTPEFDMAGGHMALVVENLARLPESDRAAVAAYLKQLPLPN